MYRRRSRLEPLLQPLRQRMFKVLCWRVSLFLILCGLYLFLSHWRKAKLLQNTLEDNQISRRDMQNYTQQVIGEYDGMKTVNDKLIWTPDVMEWLREEAEKENRTLKNDALENDIEVNVPNSNTTWYQTHINKCSGVNETWEELPEGKRFMAAQRIVINAHYKLLYCPTPMVSIGPFMRLMYAIEWNLPVAEVSSKLISKRDNFDYLSDYSIEDQINIINTYHKFIVVRHPLIRLVAVYKQKFVASNAYFHDRYGKDIIKKFRQGVNDDTKGNDVTFSEFAQYLAYVFPLNEHWMTQEMLCLPCHMHYDLSLRHESVKEDSLNLLNTFGLTNVVDAVPVDAWDSISSKEAKTLYDSVPVSVLGQLIQNYQKDFNLFDYSSLNFNS